MKKFFLVFITLIFVFGIIFLFLKILKIQAITCESQYGECNSNLKSQISNFKKQDFLTTKSNLTNLLKTSNSVLNYSINFKLPFSLDIFVIERKPIAAFVLKDGNFALVDKDGFILDKVPKTALPKITSVNLTQDQFVFVVNLVASLYTSYNVTKAEVTQEGVKVEGIQGKEVLFPTNGDKDVLLGGLNLILSRLPSVKEATTIKTIDMRFKNPVLKQL